VRAYSVQRFGEAPAIADVPTPAAPDAYLIRVTYAGVNPVDYKSVERLTAASAYPYILGVDFAGVLERVPSSERDLRAGDRVFGIARTYGTYAEYTAVPAGAPGNAIARIPDGVPDDQAAALPVPAVTALGSLELNGVAAGQWVVVMGATGGVGGYAVQMAKARGAHVIATVRGDANEARRLGAEEVYDSQTTDVIAAIKARHPHGVDAVLDVVNGAEAIRHDADVLRAGGHLVSTVYAADVPWFAERHMTAHNISSFENPLASRQGLTQVARLLAAGTITARITTTEPLDAAGALLDRLRHGGVRGKAVIRI
jgi:NADPH:quinone reductase-like Zn-dependent oxidoreductase